MQSWEQDSNISIKKSNCLPYLTEKRSMDSFAMEENEWEAKESRHQGSLNLKVRIRQSVTILERMHSEARLSGDRFPGSN